MIGRKSSLSDIGMMMAMIFTISIVILITYKVSDSINDKIQNSDTISELSGATRARTSMDNMNNHFSGIIDNSMLLIVFGLGVVAIILAMLVVVHPIFFFFYVILLTIIIFISAAFSNVYQEMALQPDMASVAADLVFTSTIMIYLPFIVGFLGFLVAIIMYKTWQQRQ